MNQYITGTAIKTLREKNRLTQAELAEKLNVSAKTVSKWETGKGFPDITLLEPLAATFRVSVTELLSGNAVHNMNVSANMLRSRFYVCPVCGNVIHSMGEVAIHCHGILLTPCVAEDSNQSHKISIERNENAYYVRIEHEMTKTHYISFIAGLSSDRLQMIKLYPEGNAETRLEINGVREIFYYCNRDGLFRLGPVNGMVGQKTG